jgi:hypothetical protein
VLRELKVIVRSPEIPKVINADISSLDVGEWMPALSRHYFLVSLPAVISESQAVASHFRNVNSRMTIHSPSGFIERKNMLSRPRLFTHMALPHAH